ncbi:citrate lyase holo-[acyl-carrier protein] synthase [uncultured Clostridium sp.]|uniref:citrate lyase holo-[acyl-carrier protein] synthase n=1 Tax=uncultured Clostridium sp. TaxID=59620 RepID=UPI00261971E3|nr:citrate lyase holo-[acyl-carrier protein] synthase [uncultured Clostridium sp.]
MNTEELMFKILDGKESRVLRQKEILTKYNQTLISFTLNIPGLYKISEEYKKVFNKGIREIKENLERKKLLISYEEVNERESGYEFFCIVLAPANDVKMLMIELESRLSIGRIFDIDVFDKEGRLLSRSDFSIKKRECLVCSNDAVVCSRSRAHSIEEVLEAIDKLVKEFILEEEL